MTEPHFNAGGVHDNKIRELHALGRSDQFIAGVTGMVESGVANARHRLGLPLNKNNTDHEVEQKPPAYLRWKQLEGHPDRISILLTEAREVFLEDNDILIQIAEKAAEAYYKEFPDDIPKRPSTRAIGTSQGGG